MKAVGKNVLKIYVLFALLSASAAASPAVLAQTPQEARPAPPPSSAAAAQARCMTEEEAGRAVSLLNNPPASGVAENKALRRELLNMQENYQKLEQKIYDNWQENQRLLPSLNETGERNFLRLCEIVKQYGWPYEKLVTEEGAAAALFITRGNNLARLRREIFPVVVAAAEKGYVNKSHLAWMIDNIRVNAGAPQIFGTQTRIRDEIFYLYPLQSEEKVDEWRKMYNLPPLNSYIRYLQSEFETVVLKSPRPVAAAAPQNQVPAAEKNTAAPATAPTQATDAAGELLELEKDEPIKVESNLVNLNVKVSAAAASPSAVAAPAGGGLVNLQKEDFVILENGVPQQIEFFSAAEAPFDLILLLDLSSSTSDKQEMIRQSTRRFVEAARPTDRIAIATFTYDIKVVSELTDDRAKLLESLKKIRDAGGSGVWAAIDFAYKKIIRPQGRDAEQQRRRSAVVIMTDGVDSSLIAGSAFTGSPTFTDLLETVRRGDTTIIPIYLDTESDKTVERKAYRTARRTLGMLAEETGGQVYFAKKVEDLRGVYERVISDLGKIYSLGYQSTDENRDGAWRRLTVQLPNHPNLTVHAKPGYYAR